MDTHKMKKPSFDGIDAILIDLDNTLFDTSKNKLENMKQFANTEGDGWSAEKQSAFSKEQRKLFEQLYNEEILLEEFLLERGAAFCKAFSIPKSKEEGMAMVHESIRRSMDLLPGAAEAVKKLAALKLPLCLASNGVYKNQRGRLEEAGLLPYFTHLFVSDSMGTIKPNAKFYRHALDVLGVEPSRVIMIGDAERDDILGANAVGIRTCYIMGKTDKEIPPEADYYVLGPADLI